MEIAAFQDVLRRTYVERDTQRGIDGTFRWLTEEVGEVARALRGDGDLVHEFGDVLAWLGSLANLAGVDLEEARGAVRERLSEVRRDPVRVRVRSMTSELITPGDEHRDEIVGLMRVAFNLGSAGLAERAAWLPVEKMRCVLEGDRIVAAAAARDFRQWFGGRELGMSGIWGVVTLPEHRGGGLATRAVTDLLEEARAKGQPLSVLYPATQRPYRGMGFELAGTMTRHAVALDDLPRGPAGPLTVEEYDPARDLDGIRACYRASVSGHQGRSTRTIRIGGRRRSSGDGSATTCSGWWWREALRASRGTRRSRSARIRVRSISSTRSTAGTWWRRRWEVGRRC